MSGYVEPTGGTTTEPSSTRFGNKPIRALMKLLSSVELDTAPSYGSNYIPKIKTPFHIGSDKLNIRNPADTFGTSYVSAALTANQKINIPILTNIVSSIRQDEPAFLNQTQTLKKKTIPISGTDPNIISDATADATHLAAFNASGNLEKKLFTSYLITIGMLSDALITTNKLAEIDIRVNNPMRISRIGTWNPDTPFGSGTLSGCMTLGIDGGISQNTQGRYKILTTRNVTNDMVGIAKLDVHTCTRSTNPLLRFGFRFQPTSSASDPANSRMFKGVGAKRLLTATSNTEPLLSTESGFLFGHGAGDTVFSVYHNDGTGTCVKTPTTITIPAVDTNYVLEIFLDLSPNEIVYTLWQTTSGAKNASPLGSEAITTRIPSTSVLLYLQDVLVTTNGAVRNYYPHYIEVFA